MAVCPIHQCKMCSLLMQLSLWLSWGQHPAAAFPRANTHWCLFLTVLHLVLFYESRLQDHHLVIPSVLQGLRALVSSHPQPAVLACTPEQCQGGPTPRCGLEQCVEQGLAGLSAHLAALPCLLCCPAVSLVEEPGRGDCLDFLPCVGIGARIPWPPWGAAQMMGILSCSVWEGGGELSLLWKRILQAAAVQRQELCYVAAIMVFYSCFSLPVPRACARCCPQG